MVESIFHEERRSVLRDAISFISTAIKPLVAAKISEQSLTCNQRKEKPARRSFFIIEIGEISR